jgi:phosphopantothenoylcysteine synthetase/decarboxylase
MEINNMLKGKKILVTAGGTQEYIDDVRVITNTSTGATGALIAQTLAESGAEIHYVYGATALVPDCKDLNIVGHRVTTAKDAMTIMASLIGHNKMDAVVHAMAVSDFTFNRDTALKCKSSDPGAFIDFMRRSITLNPKIISHIKQWYPKTILIGFKYEVGCNHEELVELAEDSIQKNGCDLVIANDKKEIEATGLHAAYLVYSNLSKSMGFKNEAVLGNGSLSKKIQEFLTSIL